MFGWVLNMVMLFNIKSGKINFIIFDFELLQ